MWRACAATGHPGAGHPWLYPSGGRGPGRAWLNQRHEAVVRVNAADTPWHADDIDMVADSAGAIAVMVSKAEDPRGTESLSRRFPAGTEIVPLVETAAGVLSARAICAIGAVARPAFGSLDVAAQLGIDHSAHHALQHMRSALVLAAAAAGCGAPADEVTTNLADDSRLHADLEHAIALGFTAKLCLHSRQVAIANQSLTPPGPTSSGAAGDRGSSRQRSR